MRPLKPTLPRSRELVALDPARPRRPLAGALPPPLHRSSTTASPRPQRLASRSGSKTSLAASSSTRCHRIASFVARGGAPRPVRPRPCLCLAQPPFRRRRARHGPCFHYLELRPPSFSAALAAGDQSIRCVLPVPAVPAAGSGLLRPAPLTSAVRTHFLPQGLVSALIKRTKLSPPASSASVRERCSRDRTVNRLSSTTSATSCCCLCTSTCCCG